LTVFIFCKCIWIYNEIKCAFIMLYVVIELILRQLFFIINLILLKIENTYTQLFWHFQALSLLKDLLMVDKASCLFVYRTLYIDVGMPNKPC
jgi:hypothetical protein